jgi:NADH-quinone oxidoreductase subunit D
MQVLVEVETLLIKNRIFMDRMQGVGVLTPARALAMGVTGPVLRSTGVAFDVRKDNPYLIYDRFDFDVPVGSASDSFDRFMVRLAEMRQSARIIEQCCQRMADSGPVNITDPRIILPPKEEVYSTIEGTIQHFKIVMEGLKLPAGEVYSYSEGGNGELGFYLVSDGSGTPYRVRIRPPCFAAVAGLRQLIEGAMIPDVVPTFGSTGILVWVTSPLTTFFDSIICMLAVIETVPTATSASDGRPITFANSSESRSRPPFILKEFAARS